MSSAAAPDGTAHRLPNVPEETYAAGRFAVRLHDDQDWHGEVWRRPLDGSRWAVVMLPEAP